MLQLLYFAKHINRSKLEVFMRTFRPEKLKGVSIHTSALIPQRVANQSNSHSYTKHSPLASGNALKESNIASVFLLIPRAQHYSLTLTLQAETPQFNLQQVWNLGESLPVSVDMMAQLSRGQLHVQPPPQTMIFKLSTFSHFCRGTPVCDKGFWVVLWHNSHDCLMQMEYTT